MTMWVGIPTIQRAPRLQLVRLGGPWTTSTSLFLSLHSISAGFKTRSQFTSKRNCGCLHIHPMLSPFPCPAPRRNRAGLLPSGEGSKFQQAIACPQLISNPPAEVLPLSPRTIFPAPSPSEDAGAAECPSPASSQAWPRHPSTVPGGGDSGTCTRMTCFYFLTLGHLWGAVGTGGDALNNSHPSLRSLHEISVHIQNPCLCQEVEDHGRQPCTFPQDGLGFSSFLKAFSNL